MQFIWSYIKKSRQMQCELFNGSFSENLLWFSSFFMVGSGTVIIFLSIAMLFVGTDCDADFEKSIFDYAAYSSACLQFKAATTMIAIIFAYIFGSRLAKISKDYTS